jgi:adenine-specific DNA methylase
MDGTPNGVTNKMVFDYIKANLNFDQLINEFDYSWVHVSYNPSGKQRKQILNAVKVGGKTSYTVHK